MRTTRLSLPLLLVLWAAGVAAGFGVLMHYKATPGETHRPPLRWPRETRLQRAAGARATLVLFAHPHCPCTHASVSELQRLATGMEDRLATQVVLVRPSGVTEAWDDTELQRRAESIPGVTLVHDDAGTEAARFRAVASGFAVLYDGEGRLRFSGGLTSSRGHEGDSFGRRRILAVLSGETPDRDDAPVFGCALGVTPHAGHMESGGSN